MSALLPSSDGFDEGNRAGSISRWLEGVRAGDERSAEELFKRYFDRLIRLADEKLPRHLRRRDDDEDVALSAFVSFWSGMQRGAFPELQRRDELWSLLVVIAARKARARIRASRAQKRGAGKELGESEFDAKDGVLSFVRSEEPGPALASEFAEETRRLLEALPDEGVREVVTLKLEGFTHDEIAARLGCVVRTVERRVRLIREIWEDELDRRS